MNAKIELIFECKAMIRSSAREKRRRLVILARVCAHGGEFKERIWHQIAMIVGERSLGGNNARQTINGARKCAQSS